MCTCVDAHSPTCDRTALFDTRLQVDPWRHAFILALPLGMQRRPNASLDEAMPICLPQGRSLLGGVAVPPPLARISALCLHGMRKWVVRAVCARCGLSGTYCSTACSTLAAQQFSMILAAYRWGCASTYRGVLANTLMHLSVDVSLRTSS